MPWKASSVMEERLRFVGRLLDGESMSDVCREFGISRKTGYKIYSRYREHGLHALTDRSRRPVRYANQLPQQVESLIAFDAEVVNLAFFALSKLNRLFTSSRKAIRKSRVSLVDHRRKHPRDSRRSPETRR
jgi:transposase